MAYNENATRNWNKDGSTPATGVPALASYFYAEFQRLYNNFKNFFNSAGTIFSINTINEKTAGHGVTVDGTNIKDGILTDDGTAGVGVESVDGSVIRQKILNIGDWDMYVSGAGPTRTGVKLVAHGIADFTKIRDISVIVRNDNNDEYFKICGDDLEDLKANSTLIQINLVSGNDAFDNNNFDSTSYNRGWVIVSYID